MPAIVHDVDMSADGSTISYAVVEMDATEQFDVRAVVARRTLPVLHPKLAVVEPTPDGFSVLVLNYDPAFSWKVTSDAGTVTVDDNGLINASGLSPWEEATVVVKTSREGYGKDQVTLKGQALRLALVPVFGQMRSGRSGFTVRILNYDSAFNWQATTSEGSAALSPEGGVEVSGLPAGTSAQLYSHHNEERLPPILRGVTARFGR